MKTRNLLIIAITMVAMAFTACNFEFSTANVKNTKMCTSVNGNLCPSDQRVFSTSDDMFFVSCDLKNAPENTLITFAWTYLEGEKILIDKYTLDTQDKGFDLEVHSSLNRPINGWPTGNYAVEIYLDNKEEPSEIVEFEVQ